MAGRFKIIKTGTSTIRIAENSSILTSKIRYRPNGSDVFLGHGEDGRDQDLRISSRSYMTEKQKKAEEASIAYATELEVTAPESVLEIVHNKDNNPTSRTAPYEAFHIKGLGVDFTPKWDDDVQKRDFIYLELDLHRSLDIRSATIVFGPVNGNGVGKIPGEDAERTDFIAEDKDLLGWPSFPSRYLFNMELDESGELIYTPTNAAPTNEELRQGRHQKKAYLMIGYLTKDVIAGNEGFVLFDEEDSEVPYMNVVGCLNTNLEVSHGLSNEIPVVNLSPSSDPTHLSSNYFGDAEESSEED